LFKSKQGRTVSFSGSFKMGCGASAVRFSAVEAKAAPNIVKYFGVTQKMLDAANNVNPMELMMDPAKMQAMTKKTEAFKEEMKTLAGQSFDHHDKDRSEYLDVAEAKVFFQNYVTLFLDFHAKNDVKMLKHQMVQKNKMMGPMMNMMGPEIKKAMQEQEQATLTGMIEMFKNKRIAYKAEPDKYNNAGFAVLDHNQDSKVYKKDIVDALTPDTEMYNNVHCALNLMDPAEVAMKQAMAEMQAGIEEMPADCPQQ